VIRKVNHTSGVITTVAGTGAAGNDPDGTVATSARLTNPVGVAVNAAGDIAIADGSGGVIQEVLASNGKLYKAAGLYSNVSLGSDGGAAVNTAVGGVWDVGFDASGNLIFLATANNGAAYLAQVRMISGGILSTLAGVGPLNGYSGDGGPATAAQLSASVSSLHVVASTGAIFIADMSNNVIRRIDNTGTVDTVAGTGTQGFSGDGGNPKSAKLNNPFGVFVDAQGVLYVTDTSNARVRKVN